MKEYLFVGHKKSKPKAKKKPTRKRRTPKMPKRGAGSIY